MTTQAQHSKLPWKWDGDVCDYDPEQEAPWLVGALGESILTGEIHCERTTDRDFIVRACNSHDDLLAVCERIDIWFDQNMATETTIAFQRLRHELTDAIAKAKEAT